PRLRVIGIQDLRVIDASIMPRIVTGNTNAAAIMIGEKGAALVLEDARRRGQAVHTEDGAAGMMTVNFAPYTRSFRLGGHLDEDLQVIVVFPSKRLKAIADCVLERNASRDDPFDRKSSACDHRDQTRS